MYSWTENVNALPLENKQPIFSTGGHDYPVRTTVIDMAEGIQKKSNNNDLCKNDGHTFADKFRDFGNDTTIHGMRYVTNNKYNCVRRLIWSLVVLGMTTCLGISIALSVIKFYRYPTTSDISINYVQRMTFPAVTLCNFNQFKRSVFTPDQQKLLSQIYGPDPPESIDFGPFHEHMAFLSNNTKIEETFAIVSHKLEDMLVECRWRSSQNCSVKNFTRRFTDHGVCFTFNDPVEMSHSLKVRNAGSREGLFMRLYAEHDEYTFGESTAAGFRMMLHPQGVTPLVKELGFSLSPGFESSVSVKQNTIKSLPWPFESNCTTSKMKHSKTYTVPTCRFQCKVQYVVKICGCRDYRWPGPETVCEPEKQISCISPVGLEFQKKNIECDCPVSCNTTTYESKISMGYWPAKQVTDLLTAKTNSSETFIRKNFLEVNIFFEELMYVQIKQKEEYSFISMQSNIGGYMGLLCGMSLTTVLEWADFFLITLFRKCRLRNT